MAIANPSFETAGTAPGEADSWTVVVVSTLVTIAAFDTIVSQAVEDFEEEWLGNHAFLFGFDQATISIGRFDSDDAPIEDFENEWLSNELFVTTLQIGVNATAGQFDTAAPETVEDFEEEWDQNENYVFLFAQGPSTAGLFDTANQAFEDFEEEWKQNEAYLFSLFGGPTTTAQFDVANTPSEDFEDEWPTLVLTTV